MKKIIAVMLLNTMIFSILAGCSSESEVVADSGFQSEIEITKVNFEYDIENIIEDDQFSTKDYEIGYVYENVVNIELKDNASTSEDDTVVILDNKITISNDGTYVFTGSLSDGQILVEAEDTAKIQIILDGVNITNKNSATIYVKNADKVFVTTLNDTVLTSTIIEDASSETNVDAVIFSKADLTLNGQANLEINSINGNGVTTKDDLVITCGTYKITSDKHGLEANNSIRISNGDISIVSQKDGMHCEHSSNVDKGYIYITGGDINIDAQLDGMDSSSKIEILNGNIDIITAGGSINAPEIVSSFGNMQGQQGQMTMPEGMEIPQNTQMQGQQGQMTMPEGMEIPQNTQMQGQQGQMTMPEGMEIPQNTQMQGQQGQMTMPEGMEIPQNTQMQGQQGQMTMPEATEIPQNTQMQGQQGQMTMPEGMEIPQNTQMQGQQGQMTMPEGMEIPQNTQMQGQQGQTTVLVEENTVSTKGIKADGDIIISNGNFNIDTLDDAIHSNSSIYILDGQFSIQTGDDAITANYINAIVGGNITILTCYEGIEGQKVEISGGVINIKGNDDGINAVKNDTGIEDTETYIKIAGGVIKMDVDNEGDGVDSNGNMYMTGGELYIWGTANFTDTPLDYDGDGYITGGTFVGVGSASQTAQNFSSESTQGSIWIQLANTQSDDIILKDSEGNIVVEFETDKEYQTITMSTPDIKQGETYTLTAGTYTETIYMETLIYGEGNHSSMQQGNRR